MRAILATAALLSPLASGNMASLIISGPALARESGLEGGLEVDEKSSSPDGLEVDKILFLCGFGEDLRLTRSSSSFMDSYWLAVAEVTVARATTANNFIWEIII